MKSLLAANTVPSVTVVVIVVAGSFALRSFLSVVAQQQQQPWYGIKCKAAAEGFSFRCGHLQSKWKIEPVLHACTTGV